jgi:hypothetical protein
MYELKLEIAHLKFRDSNSALCVVMEFELGNLPKFRAKSTMCYFGLAYSLSCSVPNWLESPRAYSFRLIDRTELDMAERPHDPEEAVACLKICKCFHIFKKFKNKNFKKFVKNSKKINFLKKSKIGRKNYKYKNFQKINNFENRKNIKVS